MVTAERPVPPGCTRLLATGLASEPALRHQSATDFARDLNALAVPPRARRWLAMAAAVLVLGALGAWQPWHATGDGLTDMPSLAVLPFQTPQLAEEDQYLGLGIADAVITQLGNSRQLECGPPPACVSSPRLTWTSSTRAAGCASITCSAASCIATAIACA